MRDHSEWYTITKKIIMVMVKIGESLPIIHDVFHKQTIPITITYGKREHLNLVTLKQYIVELELFLFQDQSYG